MSTPHEPRRSTGLVHPARSDKHYREPFDVPPPLSRTKWDMRRPLSSRRSSPARTQPGAIRRETLTGRSAALPRQGGRPLGILFSLRRSPAKAASGSHSTWKAFGQVHLATGAKALKRLGYPEPHDQRLPHLPGPFRRPEWHLKAGAPPLF